MWQPLTLVGAVVAVAAAMAELTGYSLRDVLERGVEPRDVRVYLSRVYSSEREATSDFALERGGRTLLFVWLPDLTEPVNRLVYARAIVRAVNHGTETLNDSQLTLSFSDKLWDPGLEVVDREAVQPVPSSHDLQLDVQRINDRWLVSRTLPPMHPKTGAPILISFLLEINARPRDEDLRRVSAGELEVRMIGRDWPSLLHVLDIHAIPANSAQEFVDRSREVASTLPGWTDSDVPVILALTGGRTVASVSGGPTIIEAPVDHFVQLDR